MKDLSIAQEYYLCAINDKGGFSAFSTAQPVCFVAAALLDLINNGFVRLENKKIVVTGELDEQFGYLSPMYEIIKKSSKPKSIESLVEGYTFSFTDKNLKALLQSIGGALVADGCAEEVIKKGLFNRSQKRILPNRACTENVIQKVRAELLEDGIVSDETVALVSLLNKAGFIKQYFSRHESQELGRRLKEIKTSAPSKMTQQMLDYVDAVMAAIIAATVTSK